ncbi:hypothetical protein B0H17DRAFT_1193435 [Mycena rosella]|uniref:Uncharacterized protein n=1 Tax=Mycena rosella TaxID=1033263 RepID=A0AAD7GTI2_MYCRO|nr:hypothetical protein B0H17DRAFT_1193435 [Mycena rosella]
MRRDLLTASQGVDETIRNFIRRITRLSKRLGDVSDRQMSRIHKSTNGNQQRPGVPRTNAVESCVSTRQQPSTTPKDAGVALIPERTPNAPVVRPPAKTRFQAYPSRHTASTASRAASTLVIVPETSAPCMRPSASTRRRQQTRSPTPRTYLHRHAPNALVFVRATPSPCASPATHPVLAPHPRGGVLEIHLRARLRACQTSHTHANDLRCCPPHITVRSTPHPRPRKPPGRASPPCVLEIRTIHPCQTDGGRRTANGEGQEDWHGCTRKRATPMHQQTRDTDRPKHERPPKKEAPHRVHRSSEILRAESDAAKDPPRKQKSYPTARSRAVLRKGRQGAFDG